MRSARRCAGGLRVGVVGGGLGGLSLAALLSQAGHAVTVYEAGALGGKLSRLRLGAQHISAGPSLFTFPAVWRQLLTALGEASDPLDLRPLEGGLGVHYTPFGALPLPVPPGHLLHREWQRYLAKVSPLRWAVETLLTTPPRLGDALFVRASAQLARVVGPHPSAANWLRAQRYPPALAHALGTHALNAGLAPAHAPALYALLPAFTAHEVCAPAQGMWALVQALHTLGLQRGVEFREHSPVAALDAASAHLTLQSGERIRHDLLISAVDPFHLALLRGRSPRPARLTVSGLALYAAFEHRVPLALTSVLAPSDFAAFAAAQAAGALPPDTLALVHARGRQLALLLSVPATGRPLTLASPWVQEQVRRVEKTLGVSGLLARAQASVTLDPQYYAGLGTAGGAIYGQAYPLWRAGPVHPQPHRLAPRLWQVGAGVHPGGGLPAVFGGALMVARQLQEARP